MVEIAEIRSVHGRTRKKGRGKGQINIQHDDGEWQNRGGHGT
jgi:hypothetical protein